MKTCLGWASIIACTASMFFFINKIIEFWMRKVKLNYEQYGWFRCKRKTLNLEFLIFLYLLKFWKRWDFVMNELFLFLARFDCGFGCHVLLLNWVCVKNMIFLFLNAQPILCERDGEGWAFQDETSQEAVSNFLHQWSNFFLVMWSIRLWLLFQVCLVCVLWMKNGLNLSY